MSSSPDGASNSPVTIEAVLLARDFYKFANLPPEGPPVSIRDFLVPMVEQYVARMPEYADHKIEVKGAVWSRTHFNSMLYRKKEQSTILVHYALNTCYSRFATTVELANIITTSKEESYATTDVVALLNGFLALPPGIVPEAKTPHYSEALAIALAIELLMPMCYRALMEDFIARGVDSFKVADTFKIPQTIAEWTLNFGGWKERVRLHDGIKDVDTDSGLG